MNYGNKQDDLLNSQTNKPSGKSSNQAIPKVLIGFCGCTLVLICVAAVAVYFVLRSPTGSEYAELFPHDTQVYGEKLPWRTLVKFPDRMGFAGTMAVGNFDRNPGQEILFVTMYNEMHLVRLDGSITKLADGQFNYAGWITTWDWDADGVDEIVLDDPQGRHQDVTVYAIDGKEKHRFEDRIRSAFSITGDYDGDGNDELMLSRPNATGAWIYTTNGKLLEELNCIQRSNPLMLTDLDSDGLAEALIYEYEQFRIHNYGNKERIEPWSEIKYDCTPFWAADISGDGNPDLINPVKGIFDPSVGYIPLKYDAELDLDFLDSPGTIACSIFREVPDGPVQLVVAPGNFNDGPIYMFDDQGTMTYHQRLNPEPTYCLVINDNGQDHLVVSTEEQLLIYP